MAKYYVRNNETDKVVSNLMVSDLKAMAQIGELSPNDEIRKSGHTTWHRASSVNGLIFRKPNTEVSKSESHAKSVHHDDEVYNIQSETIAEISGQISTHANEFEIYWPDGRQDGPFSMSTIQQLTSDGFVNQACQFKTENEKNLRSFASLNLIDTQPEPCSTPVTHQPTDRTSKQKKAVKEKRASKKARREKTPWAKGWFRRFVVKSVSAIVIIAAVIALGSWGLWTAMPDSQKEMVSNKYENIKKYFEDDANELVVDTGSGSVVNSNQTIGNTNASSNSMAPEGNMHVNANISIPEFGPLWVHEELRLPVLGRYYSQPYLGAWIQFLLAPPRTPIEGTIELKSYYSAVQFGKPKWFQVPKHKSSNDNPIAGAGGSGEGNPNIDFFSIELLQLATSLGISNQNTNRSALVRSWYIGTDANTITESDVDDASSGNIDRVSFKHGYRRSFFQFDRDAKKRVVAIHAYDSDGNTLGQMFRFEYAVDNTLSQFSTLDISDDGGTSWLDWTPVYNDGALISLDGVGTPEIFGNVRFDRNYRISYEYDSVGRITKIVYTRTKVETQGNGTPQSLRVETKERVLTASFVYKGSNEHWSTATVSASRRETNVRGLNPPDTATINLGTVRFEQSVYTTTSQ
jgi:hypothetical protein